jgi:hypothetical protein
VNRLASGAIDTVKPQHGAEANQFKTERRIGENHNIRQTVKELRCHEWSHDIKNAWKEEVSGIWKLASVRNAHLSQVPKTSSHESA